MGKLAVLRIGEGSFEQGFSVLLQIGDEETRPFVEQVGHLPPFPELAIAYQQWQKFYRSLGSRSRLSPAANQVKNVSTRADCLIAAHKLQALLNDWCRSEPFRPLREKWLEQLTPSDSLRILLQTDHPLLQRLPWHQLDLLERYPHAEMGLSAPSYARPQIKPSTSGTVRILAILGHSEGIDLQADRQLLQGLPHADVHFLVEPRREELSDRLWEQPWDILFFAGHSRSDDVAEQGSIYLNPSDRLSLKELKHALQKAVRHGLQLAVFNSCDGLGLARELTDVQLPQLIVMREPVPDLVAQAFLRFFLAGYAQNVPLYEAVREARDRLQTLEPTFPCATWLPMIWQNPAVQPPTWQSLLGPLPEPPRLTRTTWRTALGSSLAIALLINLMRLLGGFQAVELQAFDQLMRLRPAQAPDPRLAIITIDDEDIEQQRQKYDLKGVSLSDAALSRLLEQLEKYQPRVIGLDVYRDFAADPKETGLLRRLSQMENLVGVCKVSDRELDPNGIRPPAEIPGDRMGFSDFLPDADGVLRRHLLFMNPEATSHCQATFAFSTQLATRYLVAKGVEPSFTPGGDFRLGDTVFRRLRRRTGAYQGIDANGGQILLNYRMGEAIADTVALRDVLSGRVPAPAMERTFRDRVVMIGVTAKTAPDQWQTPLSTSPQTTLPGVVVQAQMVSQLLSAVLDRRPLLWVWPFWGDAGWIGAWAVVGGTLTWVLFPRYPLRRWLLRLAVAIAGASLLLTVLALGLLQIGGWVPLVPAAIALLLASGIGIALPVVKLRRLSNS